MALKNKIHFDIDTLETLSSTQGQAITTLESSASTAGSHISDTNNPHGVTPGQIGAVTAGELSNAIGAVVEALDWKEMVATFADLATTYPEPDEGWTASVAADNITYRYNGTEWVPILGALSPLATANNDGLMSQQDFTKLGTIESGAQPDQNSAEVPYDNQASGLVSTNVKGALDELQLNKLDVTALSATLALFSTDTPSDVLAPAFKAVTSITDADYNVSAVNINTPAIDGLDQPVGRVVSEPGIIIGSPGVITVSTVGQIRKISGNANQKASFYYTISRYDGVTQTVVTPPIAISDKTQVVESTSFEEFFASALLNNGIFGPQDRIVIDYFADQVENAGAVYQFQFGGTNPVRTLLPVPVTVIPAPSADLIVTDTANFAGQLSGADTTVQAALNTLDAHDHDTEYYTQDQLRPVDGDPEVDDLSTPAILDGRYLQTNAVGQTVQAFNANTVVDANYATFDPNGTFASLRAQATTKADVSLGSVENFAISTQGEAQSGIVNNKYMTPLRTKEAILNLSPPTDLGPVEGRLNTIEGTGTGSIAKAFADANDYTDAEILNAQLNLGNNYSVNTIGERNALLNLAVGDIVFVADDDDGKWAQYKVTVVDPLAFLKVMDQDIFLNALSAADIKAAYESNADTNAFTDAAAQTVQNNFNNIGQLQFFVRPDKWDQGLLNSIQANDFVDIALNHEQRIVTLEQQPSGGGDGIGVEDYTFTIPITGWNPDATNTFFTQNIVFGDGQPAETIQPYAINFTDNSVFGGEPNLPPQQMTFSSAATTGTVTITKNGSGGFADRFVGGFIRVQNPSGGQTVHYIITAVIDANTISASYQAGPSQNNTLELLTNDFNQDSGNNLGQINFVFMVTNNTGPNPEDPKVAQIALRDDQTETTFSIAGSIHAETAPKVFTIPQGATAITGFSELSIADGIRYYAIILGNNAFITTSNGVRRIAKFEDGNAFFNVAGNYGEEDFQNIGPQSVAVAAKVAIMFGGPANRASSTEWANATVFPSITGITQIQTVIGLEIVTNNSTSRSEGFSLTFATGAGPQVMTTDQVFLDVSITSQNIGNAVALETAWSQIKAAPVVANDTIIVVALEVPEVEIPVRMAVFR